MNDRTKEFLSKLADLLDEYNVEISMCGYSDEVRLYGYPSDFDRNGPVEFLDVVIDVDLIDCTTSDDVNAEDVRKMIGE